jgi:hypothetical protein
MEKTIIEPVTREEIRLTNEQFKSLIHEHTYYGGEYTEEKTKWIMFELVKHSILSHSRHTAHNESVFKRTSDGKFFVAQYEDSVEEMMDWEECQWDSHYNITEVFPKTIETIVYE